LFSPYQEQIRCIRICLFVKLIYPAPLSLRTSRSQRRFICLLHALAFLVALTLPPPYSLAVLGITAAAYCHAAWPRPAMTELAWREDGQFCWRLDDGRCGEGRLSAASLVTVPVWLLQVDTHTGRISVPVWFDSADAQALRRWRIFLGWYLSEQDRKQEG
jgi:hypothetical protein